MPSREIALVVFNFELRWYGVLYVAAFALAWWLLPRLQRWRGLQLRRDDWLFILTLGVAGVLFGGRLGYALFYEPAYFLMHPWRVGALWEGGMSLHGGFIGVGLALWLASRRLHVSVWQLTDVVVVPAALGLALGRIGNFINGELYVSPAAHAAAVVQNLLIAVVCYGVLRAGGSRGAVDVWWTRDGAALTVFVLLYGVLRFILEFVRVQEYPLAGWLTRGQVLTLPIIAAGVFLLIWLSQKKRDTRTL